MNQNQLLTLGAVAFAGFAVYYLFRQPGAAPIATSSGQQQRDSGLQSWIDQTSGQFGVLGRIDYSLNPDSFGDMLGATPARTSNTDYRGTTLPNTLRGGA